MKKITVEEIRAAWAAWAAADDRAAAAAGARAAVVTKQIEMVRKVFIDMEA